MWFYYDYLDSKQIENIKKYKYNSIDTSPVSNYITRPFWNWLAQNCYPSWLSPNILTLLSIFVLILAYFVMEVYDVNFCMCTSMSVHFRPIPGWVLVLTSICTFLAHTLDGSDGMQARKIGISSPLGELLDHGCDSLAAFLLVMFFISVMYICGPEGFGIGRLVLNLGSVLFLFYLSHWEKYITGALFLPWAYDPTFILMTAFLAFLPLFQPLSIFEPAFADSKIFHLVEILYQLIIWLVSVPVSLYNIYSSYTKRTGIMRPLRDALRPLWAILTFNIIFSLFMVFYNPQIIQNHPKYVFWFYGLISSNIVCRLIVAQMFDSPAPISTPLFLPPVGLLVWSALENYSFISTPLMVQDMAFVVAVQITAFAHFHYFASVIYQLTKVLDITFFTVPKCKKN